MKQYRKTPRAAFLDYEVGNYFITICTRNRVHYFGEIVNGEMTKTQIGEFVELQLKNASTYNSDFEILLFVVMPNHIHAIVSLRRDVTLARCKENPVAQRNPNPALRANPTCQRHVPTLSKYVNSLKGAVTKYATQNNIEFGWQNRYHDHFIRGTRDGDNIWHYILTNVERWDKDCFNPTQNND